MDNKPGHIGAFLIREKMISEQQLEEALQAQVVYGGKLGTILVEKDFVDEEELTKALANFSNADYLPVSKYDEISDETIERFPKRFAEKYEVCPFKFEHKRLYLLMTDPSNFPAINEISFITGCMIKPIVCPEIRMYYLLEKHYGTPRKLRYIIPPEKLRSSKTEARPSDEIQIKLEAVSSERTDIKEYIEEVAEIQESSPPQEHVAAYEPETIASLDEALKRLARAATRDDVINIIFGFTKNYFKRVALFLVKGLMIYGWDGIGEGFSKVVLEKFAIPMAGPSIFKTVSNSLAPYVGPLPENLTNKKLIGAIKNNPKNILVIPITINNKVVNVLYCDNGAGGDVPANIVDIITLVEKVPLAFATIIKKMKAQIMNE
ncbi:MAG: hypothetical protein A3G39_00410 [Deltaproteobacteria bacterium RIFCSPLOWO2_12_FULL_43_16]|nr:MAG: hypothetical protein A2Z89_00330 [Deltaproteobacteria bacterium GWA2_43_19]OGQ11169.1 MAG: hypothetical protein A3D30_02315 [Deltaproteobacteria bacterium RIFCSPHIGHO2_02_FULL_43_33]OGQ60294.1 MAG: hypothetical protein A3G39_00410 [Deltaproteobacteria bacterium RIFCSPLOWO2_12_FULL_43_16]HBR17320.1 hypothetical protein [Deltaproteobacteria bacterium]